MNILYHLRMFGMGDEPFAWRNLHGRGHKLVSVEHRVQPLLPGVERERERIVLSTMVL